VRSVVNSGEQWVKPRVAFYKIAARRQQATDSQDGQTGLLALPVVEDLDVFGDGLPGLGACREPAVMHKFVFERPPEPILLRRTEIHSWRDAQVNSMTWKN